MAVKVGEEDRVLEIKSDLVNMRNKRPEHKTHGMIFELLKWPGGACR